MNILMFGWEFPPFNHGGLGTACHGIVKGLHGNDVKVHFVLPKILGPVSASKFRVVDASQPIYKVSKKEIEFVTTYIDSPLHAYQTEESYQQTKAQMVYDATVLHGQKQSKELYGKDLFEEVHRFAAKAGHISKHHKHDVIHAHDWMTYPAGEMAKRKSKQPMIAHVHATEFDRTGGNPSQGVYDIERRGMQQSDHIIAVSEFTKQKIVENYGISADKIDVVHNAVEKKITKHTHNVSLKKNDKIVLFLGRMTLQKGPDYFLKMAQKVLKHMKNVKFVMAGTGDMMDYVMHTSADLGIAKNIIFTGFLRGNDIDRVYQMADLYVMPSISEPFGITPLEAIRNGTPVLISKQSGVSEVITNALKVNFWDTDMMANQVLSVLHYSPLHSQLQSQAKGELHRISWKKQAKDIKKVYHKVLAR